jgi:dTDP-glucose 4,6-dehydratase
MAASSTLHAKAMPRNYKNIFITGGTGFFGKSILDVLLKIGSLPRLNEQCSLTLLSRNPDAFLAANPHYKTLPALSFVQGDIRDFVFPKENFDLIIHAATEASAKLEQCHPQEMYSVCVEGTRHILDFAQQCGCKRFLLTSSGGVYGPQPPDLANIPETFTCSPVTAYGKGKLVAEQESVDWGMRYGFDTLIARCFAFVGPHLPLDTHFAVGNFIQDCLSNRPIIINGDGTPLRSYLSADDLVAWLFKILLQGEHGRAYNVGSEQALSIVELANLIKHCAGTTNEIIVRQHPVNEALPARYIPSTARAQQELGLAQTIETEEAIRQTLTYHQLKDSL